MLTLDPCRLINSFIYLDILKFLDDNKETHKNISSLCKSTFYNLRSFWGKIKKIIKNF